MTKDNTTRTGLTESLMRRLRAIPESVGPAENTEAPVAQGITGVVGSTRISTSFGDVPAELLRVRDTLRTRDGRFVDVKSIDKIVLDEEFLTYHPEARPVTIRASVFGTNKPGGNAALAPNQKVTCGGSAPRDDFREAIALTSKPGVMQSATPTVTYYVIDCGAPAVVAAEKLWISI